jgi:tetratricopeptide (TPR) repeat protein
MSRRKKTKTRSDPSAVASLRNRESLRAIELPTSWLAAIGLAIAIGIVFGRAVHSPFIFDDVGSIEKNSSIRSLWPLISTTGRPGPLNPVPELPTSGRPLVNLTFAMNYYFGGLDPFGYHAVNMVFHFLTALLVWAIVRRTLRLPYFEGRFETAAGWLAMGVALLWALHPLQTEAVVYVTQRTELMMTFFYLATIYCSLRYWSQFARALKADEGLDESVKNSIYRRRTIWLVLAVVACAAGMASKEVMVSAPLMVLLFDRTFIAGSLKKAVHRSWPLYAGLAGTWFLLLLFNIGTPRGDSAGFSLGVSAYEWWLTQAKVLLMYLKLVVWPSPLLLHYDFPYFTTLAEAWLYVVPVLMLAAAVCVLCWRNHTLGFLGVFVFAVLSPTLLVPIVTEMAAERRMYLPLLTLVVPFVVGTYELGRWVQRGWSGFSYARSAALAVSFVLAFAFGVASAKHLVAYDDEMQLWREVLQEEPNNFIAHNNLGRLLLNAGRLPEVITELQLSLAQKPDYYFAYNNLGVALYRLGRYPEAIEALEDALRLNPDFTDALQNMANTLRQVGRLPEARAKLEHALRLRPDDAEAQNNMGVLLASIDQVPQAIEHFRLAVYYDPNYAPAHINLGKILSTSGEDQEAIRELEQALRLQPNRADLHNELGTILGKNKQNEAAIEHFRIAIELDPKFAQAYGNLGLSLALNNRPAEAIASSQRGIDVARSTGQLDVAKLGEEWLAHYREELRRASSQSQ